MNYEPNRDDVQKAFLEAKADFRYVLKIAVEVSNLASKTPTNLQGSIADALMLRNILAGISINQILEPVPVGGIPGLVCLDPFSVGALARTVAETYLTMFGIACQQGDSLDQEFRLLWWEWYEVNEKIRTRNLVKSTKPCAEKFDKRKTDLANQILSHPRFIQLPDALRQKFLNGRSPRRGLVKTVYELAQDAGIHADRFDVLYQLTSSASHCDPAVARLIRRHDAIDEAIVRSVKLHVYEATAFLAFTVEEFARLFLKSNQVADLHFQKIARKWRIVLSKPFGD